MVGLHLIQEQHQQQPPINQRLADKHANGLVSRHNQLTDSRNKQHEQVFRANLVRIPSKHGSPLVNLSQYAKQQQQQHQHQQQQLQRKRRQTARQTGELSRHVVEAVAGRSVMIAEPVQKSLDCRDSSSTNGSEVLLLIDEYSGEAPIMIGQRMSGTQEESLRQPEGFRPMSKTRQQLELLYAGAVDHTPMNHHHDQLPADGSRAAAALILAPVVVGRRVHRMQQQQQQQQQQARYLFGELAPEVDAGVELRQHILRPIGIVEQIPANQRGTQSLDFNKSSSYKVSSDGSRRSTSSSSSSSAASTSGSDRALKKTQKMSPSDNHHHYEQQQQQHIISVSPAVMANIANKYTLYEGTRFSSVPEYAIATDLATGSNIKAISRKISPPKKTKPIMNKQQVLKANTISESHQVDTQVVDCDSGSYCCSDPNCQYTTQQTERPNSTQNGRSAMNKSKSSCKKKSITNPGVPTAPATMVACCGQLSSSQSVHLVDHNFCQANGHSHPNYLPPLVNNSSNSVAFNNNTSQLQQQPVILNGRSIKGYQQPIKPLISSHKSSVTTNNHSLGSSNPDESDDGITTSSAAVELMYESLAAELKAKLGNPEIGPLLLPPRDYDTLRRKQGKLDGIELRRSTNPQLVGPILQETGNATRFLSNNSQVDSIRD